MLAGAWMAAVLAACADDDGVLVARDREAELADDRAIRWSGCLAGGLVSVCEDPVSGASPQATVDGGTLLANGFRIDDKGNHVTFDFGEDLVEGTVRFTLTGIGPESLAEDTLLLFLATDTPELKNPAPTRVLELKIWGSAVDPTVSGTTRYGAGDPTDEVNKSAGILDYETDQTYEFELSWNDETQRLTLARDGDMLLDYLTGDLIAGPNNPPLALRYRYLHLAMPYLSNNAFWPIVDGVYGSVSIAATPASGGGTDGGGETTAAGESTGVDVGESSSSESGGPPPMSGSSSEDDGGSESSSSSAGSDDGNGDLPYPGYAGEMATSGCACAATGQRDALGWFALLTAALGRRPARRRR